MFKTYFLNSTNVVKLDAHGLEPVSLNDLETPKNYTPSLNSIGAPSSNRSHSSTQRSINSVHHLTPVNDFQRSIENEKNIRQLMTRFESISTNSNVKSSKSGDKMISVLEKNYNLQIQTLLEEVNQLKLDKIINEKTLEKIPKKSSSESRSDANESYKMTIDAKSSTINELEFQISQLRSENNFLKVANEFQKTELEKITLDVLQNGNLKCQVDDNQDEIDLLREKLSMKDANQAKIRQELQYLRNENLSLKVKSQNNSFIGGLNNFHTHDNSFISVCEPARQRQPTHQRSCSDYQTPRVLKFSELTDGNTRDMTALDLTPHSTSGKSNSIFPRKGDYSQLTSNTSTILNKSRLSNISQGSSLKILNEYERSLQREKENKPVCDRKLSTRLIEVKKLKSHCIEQENQRLLAMLKEKRRPRREQQIFRPEDSVFEGKSTDLNLTYSFIENDES